VPQRRTAVNDTLGTIRGKTVQEKNNDIELIDHHCHGIVTGDLSATEFEHALSESGAAPPLGTSHWDKPNGLSIRAWCSSIIDLPRFATPEAYVARRTELGAAEVNRRFLSASGIDMYLVDSGNRPDTICGVAELGSQTEVPSLEIVRMESIAEQVVRDGCTAHGYTEAFETALSNSINNQVVGLKTIVAYRSTLRIDPLVPEPKDIERAAARWLREYEKTQVARLTDPVLERHILWFGADLARQHRIPIQFHIGLGDQDIELHAVDPSHLTQYFRAVESWNVPMTLLHCYPFHRQAGILAENFPNIYFDVGFVQNWSGPSYRNTIKEALELAPFTKQLFSSDAFGLSESYFLGAKRFKEGLDSVLRDWIEHDECTPEYADTVKTWIYGGNARRIYNLPDAGL
jgi:predicted TIM-barrel fold metal-dependent hydrolase